MELILLVLREFRYFFKSKKIKKYITIVIISILFLCFLSLWNTSKASYNVVYNNENVSLADLPEDVIGSNYVIAHHYKDYYFVYYSKDVNFSKFLKSGNSLKAVNNEDTMVDTIYIRDFKNGVWENAKSWRDANIYNCVLVDSTSDVYNANGTIYFAQTVTNYQAPSILNSAEDLATGSFGSVLVEGGSFDFNNGDLYLHLVVPSYSNSEINAYYFTDNVFYLGATSVYNRVYDYGNDIMISYFELPQSCFNIDFKNGVTYYLVLNDSSSNLGGSYNTDSPTFSGSIDVRRFTVSGLTAEDIEYNRHNENIFAINSQTNAINNQTTKIEEQTNAINGTTQAVNDTNDFLKDNTVDDTQFNLPTVDVNDPTANFFDTIFMGLYNAVTNNEEKTISVEILGNNINISSADFNYLNGNEWNVLRIILSSMWVFGIGIYILKDIRKMIDKIKDGNVENMATDDIKANMV